MNHYLLLLHSNFKDKLSWVYSSMLIRLFDEGSYSLLSRTNGLGIRT